MSKSSPSDITAISSTPSSTVESVATDASTVATAASVESVETEDTSSVASDATTLIEDDKHLLTDYTCVHFKPDQWAFYRAVLRGYLLAQYKNELDAADEATGPAVLAKIGRLLNKGSEYDVLNAVNVFEFDGVSITECDMIFGMLTRVTKWATYKLSIKESPTVEGDNIFSKADYYMEQMNDWFTGVSTVTSSEAGDIADRTGFMEKLTQPLSKITENQTIPSRMSQMTNNVRKFFTRRMATVSPLPLPATVSTGTGAGAGAGAGVATVGGRNRKTRRLNRDQRGGLSISSVYSKFKGNPDAPKIEKYRDMRALNAQKKGTDILKPIKRVNTNMAKEGVEMPPLPASGAGSTLLKIQFEARDNMSAEQYFEGLSMPVTIHSKTASGEQYDQLVPQVWGHPLLMYVPFARALQCNIKVYTYASEEDRNRNQCKLKTLYTIDCGIDNALTIMILDENIDGDEISKFPAVLKRQDEYMSRFKLVVDTETYTAAEKASTQTGDAMFRAQEIKKKKEKIVYYRDKFLKRKEKREPIEKKLMDEVEEIESLHKRQSKAFNDIDESKKTAFLAEITTLTDEVTKIEGSKAADKAKEEKDEDGVDKKSEHEGEEKREEVTAATETTGPPNKSDDGDAKDEVAGEDSVKTKIKTFWQNTAYPAASEVGSKVRDNLKKYVVEPIQSNMSFTYTPDRLEKKLRKLIDAAKTNMEIKKTHDAAIQSIEIKIKNISTSIKNI
jgi:hypothetical protein